MGDYEIRAYRPGDEESILACFNLVFGENNPGFERRTLEQWEWAYRRNPAGMRVFVATCDGEVVAHYAGYPYRMRVDGEPTTFSQIIDSFIHPEHRRGLKRPGLFVQTGLAYLAETTGPGKDVVTFGWPIEEAQRLGERYFGYEIVRTQEVHGREPGAGPTENPPGIVPVERFDDRVDGLYERCAVDWGASVVRDAAYLNWRYATNPFHRYRGFALPGDGGLRGLVVYRHGDWILPNMGLVMDWLVPPDDAEAAALLHETVLAQARRDAASSVGALFVEWSPWWDRFQDWGWMVFPTDYFTVGRQAHVYDMYYLRDRWWYQLGETDLV